MSPVLKTLCTGLIALLASGRAGAADAADAPPPTTPSAVSPVYMGADFGIGGNFPMNNSSVRVYGGYTVGSTDTFGKQQDHAVELMGYSLGFKGDPHRFASGLVARDTIRATGFALSWASALKVSDDWSVNSRLGATYTHATVRDLYGHGDSWNSVGVLASAGMAYAVTPKWKLAADVNYMPVKIGRDNTLDNTMLTAGLVHRF